MQPDVIVIGATHEEEVAADAADLLVKVQGSSLVTGGTALRKAREVSELVAVLEQLGIGPADFTLEGVQAQVTSGVLGKSSSATYRLRVRCRNLERLPEVLGAITSAKNATLETVQWRYPESPEERIRWLQDCVAQANSKAQAAARALGVRLAGVHRFVEESLGAPRAVDAVRYEQDISVKRARVDLGFDLSHRKRTGLRVTVEYRVEGFEPPAA